MYDFQRIGDGETRIPLYQGLRVAIHGADEAVEATVEEVVLGQQEIHELSEVDEVITAKWRKSSRSWAAAHTHRSIQMSGDPFTHLTEIACQGFGAE